MNLAVQREISAVPLGSFSNFTYEYSASLGTFTESYQVSAPDFWRGYNTGRGRLAAGLGVSVFDLNSLSISPGSADSTAGTQTVRVNDVVVTSLYAEYGLMDRVDLYLDVPLVFTDASLHTTTGTASPGGQRSPSISSGFGLGRIPLGVKWLMWNSEWVDLFLNPEIFFPSPSSAELAGPASGSLLPRTVATVRLTKRLSAYSETGYEFDFDTFKLSRFVWKAGVGFAFLNGSVDVAGSGTHYASTTQVGTTALMRNYLDCLTGLTLALSDRWRISASLGIPLGSDDLRPTVRGTVAINLLL